MASIVTNRGAYLFSTGFNWTAASGIKAALLKNTYNPLRSVNFMSEISAQEIVATNYTGGFGGAGRKAIGSRTATEDDGNNRVVLDGADPATWANLGGATNDTTRHIAVVQEVTVDTDSPVLAFNIMDADKLTNGGNFDVQADGTLGYITLSTV